MTMKGARMRTRSLIIAGCCAGALAGCTDDPQYLQPQQALEVGVPDSMVTTATAQIVLPIRVELEEEGTERAELAAELGVEVPYVRLDDLSVSIEWSIKNLEEVDGTARIMVNGGNEYFYYVPNVFVVDPEEDEEPPPLMGDIPLVIPAGGIRTGVFREDQLLEAAIDLELITRGATNPFAAVLQIHEDTTEIVDPGGGPAVPREAFAHLVLLDLAFTANRHMVLEYTVRVRDHRRPGLLHAELLDADPGELTGFAPAMFTPPPPAE
jgi:hypothetical protein